MLTIVRKSDNVTVGSLSGTTGTIVFNTNATIPATTSVTYVVKIAGAVVNIIPPNTPFWLLRLTHLTTTGGIDAANYTNTGGPFPIMSLIF